MKNKPLLQMILNPLPWHNYPIIPFEVLYPLNDMYPFANEHPLIN